MSRTRLFASLFSLIFLASVLEAQSFSRTNYPVDFAGKISRGDINGDGRPDIFSWGGLDPNSSKGVSVLLNHGDGTFGQAISTTVPHLRGALLGDFNNDGKLDFVTCVQPTGTTFQLAIWLGDGTGHFSPAGDNLDVADCRGLGEVADFNGDGRLDIAISRRLIGAPGTGTNTITVYLGDGEGHLNGTVVTANVGSTSNESDGNLCAIALKDVGDVNRDGAPDLIASENCTPNDIQGGVALLTNDGSGHFSYRRLSLAGIGEHLRLRDVNQDGRLDIIALLHSAGSGGGDVDDLVLFLQQSDGSFHITAPIYEVNFGDGDDFVFTDGDSADLDNDGIRDIAIGEDHQFPMADPPNNDFPSLHLFYPATSDFSSLKKMPKITLEARPADLVLADFDRDGRPDVALLLGTSVAVFLNRDSSVVTCSARNASLRSVTLCSPAQGASLASPVRVLANITPDTTFEAMKIYVDGVSRFTGNSNDDLINRFFTLSAGSHRVTVKGFDKSGPFSTSHTFTVSGAACSPSSTNRTVKICAPVNGSTVSSPVRILAAVTDSQNVTVKIYVDGVVKFTGTSKSVDFSIALAPGSHHVTVRAWDSTTNFSASTTFTVH